MSIIEKLKSLKPKAKNHEEQHEVYEAVHEQSALAQVRNWYSERFEGVIIQRNILLILLALCIIIVALSILTVNYISSSKRFDPFVVQIDEETGVASVVNPLNSEIISGNEALNRYFVKQYLQAREAYNYVDFYGRAREVIRVMSSRDVFQEYLGMLDDKDKNPAKQYGNKNSTYVKFKSWSKLDSENYKYLIRFSINEKQGLQKVYHKLAILEFRYVPMKITEDERNINPVGFQIIGYRVNDDESSL
jgi:type IV secretion system protein VirB8